MAFQFVLAEVNTFSIIVAIVGYLTVFTALVLLYFIFRAVPRIYKIRLKENMRRHGDKKTEEECCVDITGQTSAAISMAIHLYFSELHDDEDMVMTIKKVSKQYSPWSSKIYGLNNLNYQK